MLIALVDMHSTIASLSITESKGDSCDSFTEGLKISWIHDIIISFLYILHHLNS